MKGTRFFVAITLITSLAILPSAIAGDKASNKAAGPSPTTVVNTILSGAGVPSKTLGINGDFYIDTKNLNLYGPKTKGVWKVATSLKSKDVPVVTNVIGESGAMGQTGAKGATGDNGATGATGPQGVPGIQGLTGLIGTTGVAGAVGLTGAAGTPGFTGAKGDAGAPGAKGDPGVAGAKGDAGATGAKGDPGVAGAKGETGTTGGKGDTGGAGAQGVAGISVAKFVTLPSATLAITTGDNATSQTFFTADTDGNYTFEVIVAGVVNSSDSFNLNAEIVVGNSAITNQFAIAASANSFANKISGRQYGFTVIGAVANVSAGAIFALRITNEFPVSGGTSITFTGRALVNKVGSIG
jgi:hypothetical protein